MSPTLKITIFLTILELSNGLGITVKVGYQLSSNRGIKQLQLATLISAAANADRVTLFRGLQFQKTSPHKCRHDVPGPGRFEGCRRLEIYVRKTARLRRQVSSTPNYAQKRGEIAAMLAPKI